MGPSPSSVSSFTEFVSNYLQDRMERTVRIFSYEVCRLQQGIAHTALDDGAFKLRARPML